VITRTVEGRKNVLRNKGEVDREKTKKKRKRNNKRTVYYKIMMQYSQETLKFQRKHEKTFIPILKSNYG
jgi:hypothetical protein